MSAMVQASTMRARPTRKSENPKNLGAFESSGTKQTRTTHCPTITRLPLYTHVAAGYSASSIIHEEAQPWQRRVRVRAPAVDAGLTLELSMDSPRRSLSAFLGRSRRLVLLNALAWSGTALPRKAVFGNSSI